MNFIILESGELNALAFQIRQAKKYLWVSRIKLSAYSLSKSLTSVSKTSGVKDQDSSNGSLALNYNYVFSNRVMIGAELTNDNDKSEIKYVSGKKVTEESIASSLALSVGYNFNDDLFNSWWIKGSLGGGSIKTESTDTTASPEKTKADIGVGFFTIEGGKRFSFDSIGLKNITYSPSIAITSASFSDDADDAGLESSTSVQLNVLKFDILF